MIEPIHFQTKLDSETNKNPQFHVALKTRAGQEIQAADPCATRAMVALMDMNAVLGGAASHYGGPAAFAELMSAAYAHMFTVAREKRKKWTELFHFTNDAGHCENGLYALKANYGLAGLTIDKLKKFRSIESALTGHGEVHLFPEGVFLSNGPLGSAFPQTQGLALGEKLSGANRTIVTAISDGACMEGEAKEAFAAIPGLAKRGLMSPYVLIISDNNTKLTGRMDDSFSMQPSFASLKTLGWYVIELSQGNDLQACYTAIENAIELAQKNPQQPVVIHAKTVKGIGNKKAAESASGGHGFPLKSPSELLAFVQEIYSGSTTYPRIFNDWIQELNALEAEIKAKGKKDSGEKIQTGISQAMIKARKKGLPILSVTSDLPGSTGVAGFRKEFPEASFDVGVAESNMISTAIGLSKLGYVPVVDTFAQFGVTKGALPFIMAGLSESPVFAVFSHTGFQDAADGASHQALSYVAMLASIPHVQLVNLSCSEEAEALFTEAVQTFVEKRKRGEVPDSYVFFLGRENFPKTYVAGAAYKLGKIQTIVNTITSESKSVTVLTSGSLVPQALKASESLQIAGVGVQVLNLSSLNQIDFADLAQFLRKTAGRIVTLEDHQMIGGLGQMVAHGLALQGTTFRMESLAVKGLFGQSSYTADELYQLHKIDSLEVESAAKKLLS